MTIADERATTLHLLFPPGASYTVVGAPPWFRELLDAESDLLARTPRVLVAFDDAHGEMPNLDRFVGCMLVNNRAISEADLRAAGFSYVRSYAVVPSLKEARWFVPLGDRVLSAAAFSLYTPYKVAAQLKLRGVRLAARMGVGHWYRDRVIVARRDRPDIEATVAALFPNTPIRLAFQSGTPGPWRKPTVAILGANGRPLALSKISCSNLSRSLMHRETEILNMLTRYREVAPLIPKLLYVGEVDGSFVTIQSVIDGRPAPRRLSEQHLMFLKKLQGTDIYAATESTMVVSLPGRIARLPEARGDLKHACDVIVSHLSDVRLPVTVVHGDFAPWNLRERGGCLYAFDWEYAEIRGLPLLDELHHRAQTQLLLDGSDHESIYQALEELAATRPYGLAVDAVRAIGGVYALTMLLRYLEAGVFADAATRAYEQLVRNLTTVLSGSAA